MVSFLLKVQNFVLGFCMGHLRKVFLTWVTMI